MRSDPSPLLAKPGRKIPEAVEGRSCGWIALGLSERGAGSNSFDCGGNGDLENVEENNDGLRTSAMMVKDKGEDGEGVIFLIIYPTKVRPCLQPRGFGEAPACLVRA